MTFSLTSNTPQVIQKTRTYSRFSDAAEEWSTPASTRASTSASRTVARRQSEHVADWAFSHFLRPVSR